MQVWNLHPTSMTYNTKLELSSLEETRGQFKGRQPTIKLGIDVHQEFYVVVCQEGRMSPKAGAAFHSSGLPLLGTQSARESWGNLRRL